MSDPHLQGVVLGPFLPFLPIFVAEQLELPQSFTGLYRTVGLISMVVSPIVLGAVLSDGRRAKPAVVLGMLGTPLAAGLFVARQPTLMVAVAVAQGVLDGVITSAALESDFGVKSVADRYKILGALKALRRGNFVILPPNSRLYGESLQEQHIKVTNGRRPSSKRRPLFHVYVRMVSSSRSCCDSSLNTAHSAPY